MADFRSRACRRPLGSGLQPQTKRVPGMAKKDEALRGWSNKQVAVASALVFCASIGMVLRTFADAITSRWPVPTWTLVLAFALYCVAVVVACNWIFFSPFRRIRSGLLQAWLVLLSLLVLLASILPPASLDARADRDDALDIGVRELLAGNDPWEATTQLGNHISPLLGGLILALPFVVILGSSVFQSVFWWVTATQLGSRLMGLRAISAIATLMLLSPVMINELVFQSDLWINAVILAIAFFWARQTTSKSQQIKHLAPSALLAALAFADRYIFLVLLIPAVAWIQETSVRGATKRWLATVASACVALYVFTFLWFPASLDSVLENAHKASSGSVPASGVLLAMLMVAVAAVASWKATTTSGYLWAMALSLAVLPAWRAVNLTIDGATTTINDYSVVSYSAAFLIFGLLALAWTQAQRPQHQTAAVESTANEAG